jgi:hypothetical protein
MSREEVKRGTQGGLATPSEALAAPDSEAALRNFVKLQAEANT